MTKDLDFLGRRLGAWGPHRATCRDALANATGQRTLSYASGGTPCSFVNGRQGVPVRKERAAACRPTPDKARSQGGPRPVHEWRTPRFPSSRLASFCPVMESDAASAELRKRKREEYEMQLFGFHSRAVYATRKSPPAF